VPEQLLAAIADAQQRLDDAVTGMDRSPVGEPSLLPGWTRAHVLAHLAANSDSQLRRTRAAVNGIEVEVLRWRIRTTALDRKSHRDTAETLIRDDLTAVAANITPMCSFNKTTVALPGVSCPHSVLNLICATNAKRARRVHEGRLPGIRTLEEFDFDREPERKHTSYLHRRSYSPVPRRQDQTPDGLHGHHGVADCTLVTDR
jgi:Mycothiol maleylpyruvate isomerase N-terminal domain